MGDSSRRGAQPDVPVQRADVGTDAQPSDGSKTSTPVQPSVGRVARRPSTQHTPAADAEAALDIVLVDPKRAITVATAALGAARRGTDPATESTAHRALGLAWRALDDAGTSAVHLRRAISTAHRHGLTVGEAEARMSYALVLADLGHPRSALRELDHACADLDGLKLARATMQRSMVLHKLGRDDEALAGYNRALETFRRHGDLSWQARTRINRGVVYSYRGEIRQARADLDAAEDLFTRLGLPSAVAQVQHNIGFLAAQAGDVPTALHWYDRAHAYFRRNGIPAVALIDRAELLLSARLLPEARSTVEEAIDNAARGKLLHLLGQAQLLSAQIALAGGHPESARDTAALAARTFDRQGSATLAVLARRVAVAARIAAGDRTRRALKDLDRAADELAAASWLPHAWDAWIDAAHLATELGDRAAATASLAKAANARRSGPAQLRARAWHAQALLDLHAGRTEAAKRAAANGYREIEAHLATLGATELGVRSTGAGVDIAALRLDVALRDGDPREALRWLQRCRSAALRLPPARPSNDAVVEQRLSELRRINAELSATPPDAQRTRHLLRRQRAVEAEVRRRAWQARADDPESGARPPSLAELSASLGDAALVELFVIQGHLHALVMVGGTVRHRPLCAAAETSGELAALRFAVRRHLLQRGTAASRATAREAMAYSRSRLDTLLFAPLADLIGDRPLVVAPTGDLHALAWPMLDTCRDRPMSVTPSSWMWWRATGRPVAKGGVVLVAGAYPPQAPAEVAAIGEGYPDASVLTGARASVSGVLAALDGAASAHLATHGEFRADNPLFSHLQLVDGPLTVYDLSALRHPPGLLILSACDSGLSAVHPGDELQGLAVALLGLGTRTVVASLGPVDDEGTRQLMVGFYDRLRAGAAPATALAAAQAALDPAHDATGGSFVCLGAG